MSKHKDQNINSYEFRPVRPFIQIPEKVLMYTLQLTPSSFSKVYLYLYNISYGAGKNHNIMYTSVREIAKNLNLSVGRTHNAISYFKKLNALIKLESKAVLGTKFQVNVPEYSSSGNWYFTKPENVRYLMLKKKLLTSDKIVESKVKRYKSIKDSLKIGLFDKE